MKALWKYCLVASWVTLASSAGAQLNSAQLTTIPSSPISTNDYVTVLVPVEGCFTGTTTSQQANAPAIEGFPSVSITPASLSSTGLIDISVTEKDVICNEVLYSVPVALGRLHAPGGYKITFQSHNSSSTRSLSLDIVVSGSAAGAVAPLPGLWAITSEVNGLPGRGFQVELHGGTLILTFYGYDSSGKGRFWLASGSYANNKFNELLRTYDGGTSFGGIGQPAQEAGTAGYVALTFTSPTTGSITLPGETAKTISYFEF